MGSTKTRLTLLLLAVILAAGGWYWLKNASLLTTDPTGGIQIPGEAAGAGPKNAAQLQAQDTQVPARVARETATVDGLSTGLHEAAEQTPPSGSPVTEALTGPVIRARVVDPLGEPLRDRDLHLSPMPAPDPGEFFIPRFPGHSDGEGRLEVPLGRPLPRSSPYAFRIEDPATGEFGWSQLDHGMSNTVIDIGDVVVEPANEKFPVLVDGWVRSTAGEPVPGLTGTVATASMFQMSPSASGPPRDTRDRWYGHLEFLPSGEFRLYGDPRAKSVRLEIQAPGFIPYLAQDLVVPSHGLEIELTQTVQWSGRLKLPTPGPGAGEYNLRIGSGTQLIPGTVSESGEFSISGPSDSDRLDVLYGQLGTPLLTLSLTAQAPGDYNLGTLDLTEKICAFDFELQDAAGQPWPRAPIVISFAGGIQPLATDESGRLRGAVSANEEWIELFGGHPDRLRIDPCHPPVPVVLPRP